MKTDTCEANVPIGQLKAISSWVSSVQDLDKLLQLIIESATGVVQAEAASLLLLNPKIDALYFKVATGAKGDEVKDFTVKVGQGIAGHVAQTGQPLLIADAKKDNRWMREISDRNNRLEALEALRPTMYRWGGSRAQREVVEDVLGRLSRDSILTKSPLSLEKVLEVDHLAFPSPWQLSHEEIRQAMRVAELTTVAEHQGEIIGYQISTLYH